MSILDRKPPLRLPFHLENVINKPSALGLLTASENAQGGESNWNQFITYASVPVRVPHALLSPPTPLDQGAWIYTRKLGSSSDDGTVPALSKPQIQIPYTCQLL